MTAYYSCAGVGAATALPEEEEDEFYESLDRILSSSCSSTSASDDDSSAPVDHHRRRRAASTGGFFFVPPPPALSSFDVWTSEPASVAERRRLLLQRLGLAGDPSLARLKSVAHAVGGGGVGDLTPGGKPELGRPSGHSPRLNPSAKARLQSDGSVHVNSSTPQSDYLSHHQRSVGNSPAASSKPPLGVRSRPSSTGNIEVSEGDVTSGGAIKDSEGFCDDPRCLIKNLDDGREFVVKEFREDGMWNKLREVGTGRQLTMEEFEMCVGRSPIVQELMRRQNVDGSANSGGSGDSGGPGSGKARTGVVSSGGTRWKKRGSWFKSIRSVAGTVVAGAHHRERRSSDEKDTSSEKGGRRSSSATDDSQDGSCGLQHCPERIKVRQYGKSHKELSGLYMIQEIPAHNGAIWSIKFSSDGRYLASAGEDCVIHVWEVAEVDRKADLLNERPSKGNGIANPFVVATSNGSPDLTLAMASAEGNHWEKKRRAKVPGGRKSMSSEPLMMPEHVFALLEKPICSFRGHLDDVLDLSWSKSQYLLSSSMDKTVRLWDISSNSCLKSFSHSDYVTCIQFNPVDDRYFISGSLDEKVRIWSIPNRQIVDWNDLHEMVTAACYTPDGKGALVGSHKGSCHLYDTSDNKLLQRSQIDLESRKKKSKHKKITGFQFAPGSSSKVLTTSADSRIRVIDGDEMVHKFKGFRNTSSQMSAYYTSNGKYVVCASEDSHVYVWRYDDNSRPKSKGAAVTQSYEHFHCQDVTVAVPWPRTSAELGKCPSNKQNGLDGESPVNFEPVAETSPSPTYQCFDRQPHSSILNPNSNRFSDRVSATWPEELMTTSKHSPRSSADFSNGDTTAQSRSAWGLVIVTAGHGGEIRAFQNFGFPVRI